MKLIQIQNKSGQNVGTYDFRDNTYHRIVNNKQIFLHPKYENMLSISKHILHQLHKLGCQRICFTLTELYDKPCNVYIDFIQFLLKREELHFVGKRNSDKQYGCRLKHWTKLEKFQETLGVVDMDVK